MPDRLEPIKMWWELSVRDIPMPGRTHVRVWRRLDDLGITTISQLVQIHRNEMMRGKNFGITSLENLEIGLQRLNIPWPLSTDTREKEGKDV